MLFFAISFFILFAGGLSAFFCTRKKIASYIGAGSVILASLIALYPTVFIFLGYQTSISYTLTSYALPIGNIVLELDFISALFLIPTLIISALCAFYGINYMDLKGGELKQTGSHWFFYNILVLGLMLTFLAADAFLFMVSWEIMSLTPFFLIVLHNENEQVRKGAWTYLIAAHIGALFLLGFFILLSAKNGGSLDFNTFLANSKSLQGTSILFVLALIGFGTKSGLMPMHVWLPEAYVASPGHVAGIISGVVTNTGIYGLIRALTFLMGTDESWWAFALIAVGGFSALLGVFFAISKKSIKEVLAFSSIENMGIVVLGIGFSLYALQNNNLNIALFSFLGALLHLFNHSFYKSLLFLIAESVQKGTGTNIINLLGGLQKKVPKIGFCFFIAAAAICALPPLNGFAGKFILYISFAIGGTVIAKTGFLYWGGIFILATVSGFSLLCFSRIFGLTFLGNARSKVVETMQPTSKIEHGVLISLAGLCFLSALLTPFLVKHFISSLEILIASTSSLGAGLNSGAVNTLAQVTTTQISASNMVDMLTWINLGFLIFIGLVIIFYIWRKAVLRSRKVSTSLAWDCGYARPTPRIQYTGGSFSQAAIYYLSAVLKPKVVLAHFASYFPASGKAELSTDDWIKSSIYSRLFLVFARIALWAKGLQQGRVNTYILYIFITLVVLLAWKIR